MDFFIFLIVAIILILVLGIKIVEQQSVLIIETLGKFSRILRPGFNIIIPVIQRVRAKVSLFVQNLEFSIVAITADKVTVTLDTTLVFKVMENKVSESFYTLSNPISVMKSTIENSIRSFAATQTHEEILQKRDEMTEYLVEHLREKFENWGREIIAFQVKDVVLPAQITSAMSQVIASKRLQEAAEFEANAEKIKVVKAAEAERESRKLSGIGVAEEREAIVNGLKISIENMKESIGVDTNSVMNVVMLTQYLDMLKSISNQPNSKIVFLNSSPGNLDEIIKQIYGMIKS
ncbi:MAG: stomatin-like protein [Patescibacteria group bacterium]